MNDNEILVTGELCEALLSSSKFIDIVGKYELTIAADFLATAPADKAKREELYASLWGARGLLEFMKLNANAAASIRNPNPQVTTDGPPEGYYDPRDDESELDS